MLLSQGRRSWVESLHFFTQDLRWRMPPQRYLQFWFIFQISSTGKVISTKVLIEVVWSFFVKKPKVHHHQQENVQSYFSKRGCKNKMCSKLLFLRSEPNAILKQIVCQNTNNSLRKMFLHKFDWWTFCIGEGFLGWLESNEWGKVPKANSNTKLCHLFLVTWRRPQMWWKSAPSPPEGR